jgi:hypothetical protein
MPRPYHSPSSVKLARRCLSAWAREYLLNIREPRVLWKDIAGKPNHRQRGPALGVAVHEVYESWYTPGGEPVWTDFPGQIALSGAHLIPHPSRCAEVSPEGEIGTELIVPALGPNRPTTVLRVDGVPWSGFRDLLANAPDEWARLGVAHNDGWGLVDYKSTGSITKWALAPADLLADLQANTYTIDVCERLGLTWIPGRWLYLETTAARRHAEPRDVPLVLSRAYDVVGEANILARELDTLHDAWESNGLEIERVPKNVGACNDYRGCAHHVSRGGGCNAKPPPIMRLKRKEEIMPLNPALVKKQQDLAAQKAPPPATDAPVDAAEPAAEPATTPVQPDGVTATDGQARVGVSGRVQPARAQSKPAPAKAKGPAPLDLAQPFTLEFIGGQLSADVLTLTKVVPAIGAERYTLSQNDFAIDADATSLALLLAALPAA